MMTKIVFFVVLAVICASTFAKDISRCDLVKELRKHGFPEDKLADWVCLVEAESSRKTHKIGKVNKNGSRDYGLFQINDKYWCSNTNTAGKDCNVTCADVTTDDITKAAVCAKKVYRRHNFMAWYGWRNKCQGKSLPDISSC